MLGIDSYYLTEGLAIFAIIVEASLLFMHIISFVYAKLYMNSKPPPLPKEQMEGVSILKPLKGFDLHLERNLETFFNLEYPKYEIIICLEDVSDTAYPVAKRLIAKYPDVDAKIVTGGKRCGPNPKVNNIMPGYDIMKYDVFWMCDQRIRAHSLTLWDLASKMTEGVAMVHALPYTCNRIRFSSTVEKIYFSTQHSRVYMCAHMLGVICTTGMSFLIKRKCLQECAGGLGNMSVYIAEDYFIGKHLSENGYKLALASYPALQNAGNYGLKEYIDRMIRWTRIRLHMVPRFVILEPFSECLLTGLLFSWACYHFFSWNVVIIFLCHVTSWLLFDYFRTLELENAPLKMSKKEFVAGWLVREVITIFIILSALYDPTFVIWANRKYRLGFGGAAEEIFEK